MFKRFSRSWELVKASVGVLAKDKHLLAFPLLSGICSVIVVLSFLLPMLGVGLLDSLGNGNPVTTMLSVVVGFAFYLVQYLVIFFFNSALVAAATIRLDGGNPTLRDGLRIAGGKFVPILGYAAIAATVGMILRAVQKKAGWLGNMLSGILGIAWTVASFLVVPILVNRDIGPMQAVKESALLLKTTWGENLIGQGGVGMVFGFVYSTLILLAGGSIALVAVAGGGVASIGSVIVIAVLALVLVALIHAALSGIYSAALYRYAMGEGSSENFDRELLESAFATR